MIVTSSSKASISMRAHSRHRIGIFDHAYSVFLSTQTMSPQPPVHSFWTLGTGFFLNFLTFNETYTSASSVKFNHLRAFPFTYDVWVFFFVSPARIHQEPVLQSGICFSSRIITSLGWISLSHWFLLNFVALRPSLRLWCPTTASLAPSFSPISRSMSPSAWRSISC